MIWGYPYFWKHPFLVVTRYNGRSYLPWHLPFPSKRPLQILCEPFCWSSIGYYCCYCCKLHKRSSHWKWHSFQIRKGYMSLDLVSENITSLQWCEVKNHFCWAARCHTNLGFHWGIWKTILKLQFLHEIHVCGICSMTKLGKSTSGASFCWQQESRLSKEPVILYWLRIIPGLGYVVNNHGW